MTRKADSRPFSSKVVDRSGHCYRYSFRLFSFSPFQVGSRWRMVVGDRESIHLWGLWVGKDREGERVSSEGCGAAWCGAAWPLNDVHRSGCTHSTFGGTALFYLTTSPTLASILLFPFFFLPFSISDSQFSIVMPP